MFISRTLFAAIAASVLLSAAAPLAQVPCDGGAAAGSWRLPIQVPGTGIANARLIDSSTGQPAYRLRALLTGVPTPCLSCIQGDIVGVLDDGVGPSPDFVVRGSYTGTFDGGSGRFQLRVLPPSGGATVGFVTGEFEDPLADGIAGQCTGVWRICP